MRSLGTVVKFFGFFGEFVVIDIFLKLRSNKFVTGIIVVRWRKRRRRCRLDNLMIQIGNSGGATNDCHLGRHCQPRRRRPVVAVGNVRVVEVSLGNKLIL